MKFRTHTGELIEGEKLQVALNHVADWYVEHAEAVRNEDCYANHVTIEQKEKYLAEGLEHAEAVRDGKTLHNFTTWQRVNEFLTGECVALLPK